MDDQKTLQEEIIDKALSLGFDAIGFARPDSIPNAPSHLKAFVDQDRHGSMTWMEERMTWRSNPAALWPEAKTVIMLGLNYGPDHDPLHSLAQKSNAAISVYAQNKDYHDLIKKRLKQIGRWLHQEHEAEIKVFVDTAPVMEKPLAMQAGLGWQGKHTNLVSQDLGSWFFLGAIFTTLEFSEAQPEEDHCGSCQACLDVCPTKAFPAPYQLDARRCISYLTIEHKDHIDVSLREGMGNRIYGCDDCLAVCPWNKFASTAREAAFHARDELRSPPLKDLAALSDDEFRAFFSGSPIKRIKRDRFVRNVLIAIGNSGDVSLSSSAEALLPDPSPLVRAMAVWACYKLLSQKEFDALRSSHAPQEKDPDVLAEWERGTS